VKDLRGARVLAGYI